MKILFCGEAFPEARTRLAALLPDDEILAFPPDKLGAHVAEADVVVPLVSRVDEAFIRQGTFGLVQQYGVGLETVDIEAATRNGVMVARIPSEESGNAASVAEHAVLLMLMLSRRWNEIGTHAKTGCSGHVGVAARPGTARKNRLHRRPWRGRKGTGPAARRVRGQDHHGGRSPRPDRPRCGDRPFLLPCRAP